MNLALHAKSSCPLPLYYKSYFRIVVYIIMPFMPTFYKGLTNRKGHPLPGGRNYVINLNKLDVLFLDALVIYCYEECRDRRQPRHQSV